MTTMRHGRAILRPWAIDDTEDLLAAFADADMVSQGSSDVQSVADATAWIAAHPWDGQAHVSLAVDVEGRAVGNVSLSRIDRRHDAAWMSYWISEPFRGRGLASRATASLAAWAFTAGELFRLELGHRLNNPASGRVAHAAGFVGEGVQREKLRYGAERFDVAAYARLATDPTPEIELLPLLVEGR